MTQTTSSPEISVVVPLFNEEESIAILQTELSAALKGLDYETIFVDDGSVDRTAERIETAPNIRLIRFEKNSGQSAAIYAGLTAARGGTVVIIDGDLQNDPADIPKLLAEIARGARSRLRLSRPAPGHTRQACDESDCKRCAQSLHERRGARHRLHP